jgi:hypothetical protein
MQSATKQWRSMQEKSSVGPRSVQYRSQQPHQPADHSIASSAKLIRLTMKIHAPVDNGPAPPQPPRIIVSTNRFRLEKPTCLHPF